MATVHAPAIFGPYEVVTITNGTFRENCYVLLCANRAILIDPGSDAPFIADYCDSRGIRVEKILLTHGHFDHLGAVAPIMERYRVECEVHERERTLVRQASIYAYRFDAKAPMRAPRDLTFITGSSIHWSAGDVGILTTPGHTAGSISFRLDSYCVFTGDALLRERAGPAVYPESDPGVRDSSIRSLLDGLPDNCVILPGHGRPWNVGEARIWFEERIRESPRHSAGVGGRT